MINTKTVNTRTTTFIKKRFKEFYSSTDKGVLLFREMIGVLEEGAAE